MMNNKTVKDVKTIEKLIEEANNYDRDIKIMAANDLCERLLEENQQINSQNEKQIVHVFLTHLDSESNDVQGNAIKLIGQSVLKINQSQLAEILNKLIKGILEVKTEIKDIYVTCIRTVIQKVTNELSQTICTELLLPAINQMDKVQQDSDIQNYLIEIIDQVFRKFPVYLLEQNLFDKEEFSKKILDKISSENRQIKKHAQSCLGSLSVILLNEQVQRISLSLQKMIQDSSSKKVNQAQYLQALNSLTKFVSHKLGETSTQILPFLIKNLQIEKNSEMDDFEFLNELIECYLQIIENFVKGCQNYIRPHLKEILELSIELLQHDPNCAVQMEGDAMEIEGQGEDSDEYGWDDDQGQDDCSWRVRRASIHLINTLMHSSKKLLQDITQVALPKLIERFLEKDDNVRLDAIQVCDNYLKIAIYSDAQTETDPQKITLKKQSSIVDQNKSVYEVLVDQVFKVLNCTANNNVKLCVSTLLLHASQSIPSIACQKWTELLNILQNIAEKNNSQNNGLQVQLLEIVKIQLSYQLQDNQQNLVQYYQQLTTICQKSIQNNYYKIQSEGFKLLTILYMALRPSRKHDAKPFQQYVQGVLPLVYETLQKSDIDTDIKNSAIKNLTQIINSFGDLLNPSQLTQIFDLILQKLKNEVTRMNTLQEFSKLPVSIPLQIDEQVKKKLIEILQELDSFLQKQSRTLKISTLETIKIILEISKNHLNVQIQNELVQHCVQFIKVDDFYLAQLSLELLILTIDNLGSNKSGINVPYQNLIEFSHSPLLQGIILKTLMKAYSILNQYSLIDSSQTIQKLMSINNIQSLTGVSLCIASIISSTSNSSLKNQFITTFLNQTVDNNSQNEGFNQKLALLVVKQIGKQENLCKQKVSGKFVIDVVIDLFNSKQDDVRNYASQCLGGLCLGNQKEQVPNLLKMIKTSNNQQNYLYLNSLLEVIESTQDKTFVNEIATFLFEFCENKDEYVLNTISECIGKLCKFDLQTCKPLLISNMKSNSVNRNYVSVNSFKSFITKELDIHSIQDLMPLLQELMGSQDILTCKATILSLNQITYTLPQLIRNMDISFYDKLNKLIEPRPDLVKTVDLGSFKHYVDEGLPMRNAAYSLIETLMDIVYDKIDQQFIVNGFLNFGLKDSSDEIQIITMKCIEKLAYQGNLILIGQLDNMVKHMGANATKLAKNVDVVNKKEGDRTIVSIRAIKRCLDAIKKVPGSELNAPLNSFYKQFTTHASIKSVL